MEIYLLRSLIIQRDGKCFPFQIMVQGEEYSPGQVAFLFTFLARQIAKGDNCLTISRLNMRNLLK